MKRRSAEAGLAQKESASQADDHEPGPTSKKLKQDQEKEQEKDAAPATSKKMKKAHRRRKKQLFSDLVAQMEFYFSDANLTKSTFMPPLIGPEGTNWVDLAVFTKFNKLTQMLRTAFPEDEPNLEHVYRAIEKTGSALLEVKEETQEGKDLPVRFVRRRVALNLQTREEESLCTLYAEGLPPHATNDEVRRAFAGLVVGDVSDVTYVSLPRFKHDKSLKGFTFVQYRTPELAQKALSVLEGQGRVIEEKVTPEELVSVKAFHEEKEIEQVDVKEVQVKSTAAVKADEQGGKEQKGGEEGQAGGVEEEEIKEGDEIKKRKKKYRQQKKKSRPSTPDAAPAPPSSAVSYPPLDIFSLQVMSHDRWRKLRNVYLNQQRANMTEAKKRIRQEYVQQQQQQQQQQYEKEPAEAAAKKEQRRQQEISFVPDIIVKFEVNEPIADRLLVKRKVVSAFVEPVSYVDVFTGRSEYYVRCANAEQAIKLSGVATLGERACVLKGQEEQDYWQKIQQDRQQKLSTKEFKPKKPMVRGKNKILQKIEVLNNSHKYFDDE